MPPRIAEPVRAAGGRIPVQALDETSPLVGNPFHVRQEDEASRMERRSEGRGGGIRVHVEQDAVAAGRDRRDHRQQPRVKNGVKQSRVRGRNRPTKPRSTPPIGGCRSARSVAPSAPENPATRVP